MILDHDLQGLSKMTKKNLHALVGCLEYVFQYYAEIQPM